AKSDKIIIPKKCPSCGTELEWNNDFLKCNNSSCKAQIEQSISHWFKTLGNADWFGIKTIQKLVENNYDCLEKIYSMSEDDFKSIGFGPVQSKNLKEAINISKNKPVEDWRFLAAFGISNLGKGDSRKLLSHMKIEELINAKAENIKKIPNFGPITSSAVEESIKIIKPAINHMLSIGFNLERTLLTKEQTNIDSAIVGKHVVFTGKMNYESREKIQEEARRLGAIVQTSISSKTDYLICGKKTGASKIEKAKKMNIQIISEEKYNKLINKRD
ncbi:MAG: helix-hairpin-helix domain-containing protein, partial [Deltaproteobacteria bacterium]|nr:helix-hairpin-helix domain-containing protein [Deltaproteobacteria bacterium]